jgi:hypothetical protein
VFTALKFSEPRAQGKPPKPDRSQAARKQKTPEFLLTRCARLLVCQLAFRQREVKSPESFVGRISRCDTGFFALGTGGAGDFIPVFDLLDAAPE